MRLLNYFWCIVIYHWSLFISASASASTSACPQPSPVTSSCENNPSTSSQSSQPKKNKMRAQWTTYREKVLMDNFSKMIMGKSRVSARDVRAAPKRVRDYLLLNVHSQSSKSWTKFRAWKSYMLLPSWVVGFFFQSCMLLPSLSFFFFGGGVKFFWFFLGGFFFVFFFYN